MISLGHVASSWWASLDFCKRRIAAWFKAKGSSVTVDKSSSLSYRHWEKDEMQLSTKSNKVRFYQTLTLVPESP